MAISPRLLLPLALASCCPLAGAAVPPPEKLLPKDTVLVVTAPDWAKASSSWSNGPYSRLWRDPSLKPFKDKFIDKFTTGVIRPLEQNLGVKFSDFQDLAQGQVTYALVPVNPVTKSKTSWVGILLVDSKDHAPQLKTNLAQVIKKWAEAGKPMKSRKIREADFTTLIVPRDDLSWKKLFPGVKPDEPSGDATANPAGGNVEITLGQSDSLLLVSDSTEAIDKVLSRQTGGLAPPLEESPAFQADYGARLRQAYFYAWLNTKSLFGLLGKPPTGSDDDATGGVSPMKMIFSSTGLMNLNSASLSYQTSREGNTTQIFLAVAEDQRPAVLKILAPEPKDSGPPSFVPADAVKFWRWRLNIARSWRNLEVALNDVLPLLVTQMNVAFASAGKDKDPQYDLKSELLNNLGDDIISYEKTPKPGSLADLRSPPTLYLLASPNPDKLAAAIKVLAAIPFQGAPIKDREFLGRKIYTAAPAAPATAAAPSGSLCFCASGGYVALSTDTAMLEEYLRGSETKSKSLRDMPGLSEAAEQGGGMGTGFFGMENENQTTRPSFDIFRNQAVTMQDMLGTPLPASAGGAELESLRQWADFSLLPPFDAVSKYFYFTVYSGNFTHNGFSLKIFKPTPPQLRH